MNNIPNKDMRDEEMIDCFRSNAINYEKGIIDADVTLSNRSYRNIQRVKNILIARGIAGRLLLLPLLDDPKDSVRYFAATYLLVVLPERGRAVLEDIASQWTGLADITIYAHNLIDGLDSGSYKPS